MASVLCIVSKAAFKKLAPSGVAPGHVIDVDRYTSTNRALDVLGKGDAIFLVTVRPDDELWLVGILDGPKKGKSGWTAAANTTPVTDISVKRHDLVFSSGKGIKAKKGKLGMSLQTPRALTPGDVVLLRGSLGVGGEVSAGTLRFDNLRNPLDDLDELARPQYEQLAHLTRKEQAGKPEDVVDEWSPMDLVDVLDVASGTVTHQLYLWVWGSGALFPNNSSEEVGTVIQHYFDMDQRDLELCRGLAEAYRTTELPLSATTVDGWNEDTEVETYEPEHPKTCLERMEAAIGLSTERYRLFEKLTAKQRKVVVENIGPIAETTGYDYGLEQMGLPSCQSLRRWAGVDPPTPLERNVGRWPVWLWLNQAVDGHIAPDRAVAKVLGELTPKEVANMCRHICDHDDYFLFGRDHRYNYGDTFARDHAIKAMKLLAALIDGSSPRAATGFAEHASTFLAKEPEFWLAAIACYALAAAARRRDRPFPPKFYKLAQEADFLGCGIGLQHGGREFVEVIAEEDRASVLAELAPYASTSYDENLSKGRRREVPTLLWMWHYADLVPTEKTAKLLVDDVVSWDDRQARPKKAALEVLSSLGPLCIPYLKRALKSRKEIAHRTFVERALKRLMANA